MSEEQGNEPRFERRRKIGMDRITLDGALHVVDSVSRNLPISKTLRDLQLVVERMTFSKLYERWPQDDAATRAEVDLYFRDEVSEGMLQFVRWMAEHNQLRGIAGDHGRVFLGQCMARYRKMQEVQVTTVIALSEVEKAMITDRLRSLHPDPARILFNVSPSMIAGIVIDTGTSIVDKSLRTHVTNSISKAGKLQAMTADE